MTTLVDRPRDPTGRQRGILLLALFIAGLAMRAHLVGIGPLLPSLRADLEISYAVAGLLVTLPVLSMGLVALPASLVADRYGAARGITACLVVLTVDGLARAIAPEAISVLLLSIPIGVAIGVGSALLPVVAKETFPRLGSRPTGAFASGFILGSGLASALAAPLAHDLGGWRAPLIIFSVVTGGLAVAWWLATRGLPSHIRIPTRLPRPPWRRPVAWYLVAIFGLQSLLFFGLVTWLPAVYVERGSSEVEAGLLVGAFVIVGLPVTIVATWASERVGSRRTHLAGAALATLIAVVGVVVLPQPALLWALLAGAGLGVLFPVSMMLPLDVSVDPRQVGGFVGLMFGVGYVVSAIAPFALGAMRDLAGSFTASLWMLAAAAGVILAASLRLGNERLQHERMLGQPTSRAGGASA